ncbi:MAG TPA: beta-1,3-glucanase family protein [Rhizomicrobium sp.]|jgi:hypothetical protein|nr:beta-1,3-glucanase family protein [Rhizomicrobium sp.]
MPADHPLLHMVFTDTSGRDGDIHVGFIPGDKGDLAATDAATGAPIHLCRYLDTHWYKLSDLPKGISISRFVGGRIYFCYGRPWEFERSGYEPSPAVSGDANYFRRYDKMELTYTPIKWDVADTTSFDYFSIPLALNSWRGGLAGTRVAAVTASTTDKVVPALDALTNGAAHVKDPKTGAFVRVIGPGVYPPLPGRPISPYDNFESYFEYLQGSYAPAHGNVVARIEGWFGGVGEAPVTDPTRAQDYAFTAAIDAGLNITLTGAGTLIGERTIRLGRDALLAPDGMYGSNPHFSIDGAKPAPPANDIYGWMVGDLLAGLNVGAVGSTVRLAGTAVGEMASQDWFKLKEYFGALQPKHPKNYNQWAATMSPLSQAYNFAYTDRFAHVVATLNPEPPVAVDTLEVVILPDK